MNNEECRYFLELWHGGRDLEYGWQTPKASAKGRWEHGPGLYLTTHYERARSYAKGGGKTYLVGFELGRHIKDVAIAIEDAIFFVNQHAKRLLRKEIVEDLHHNAKKTHMLSHVKAQVLVNLMVNYQALQGENTLALNRFLVEQGVDYDMVHNFGGRDETVVVIYNLDKIKKVKAFSAKDVLLTHWVSSITPMKELNLLKTPPKKITP